MIYLRDNVLLREPLRLTGEIGWDQPEVRADVVAGLSLLGIAGRLATGRDGDGPVSPAGATVPVLVVRPREELQLCRDTLAAVSGQRIGRRPPARS